MNANDIVTIITAIGILSTVIGGVVIQIITAKKTELAVAETKNEVVSIKEETLQQTDKLENIEILVDGRYSAVLQELADVKRLLANTSGLQVHIEGAEKAQIKADDQEARVDKVEKK